MFIGSTLKAIRKYLNLTQKQVQERSGISVSSLSRYENDKRVPTIEIIEKLAFTYGCTLDDIVKHKIHLSSHKKENFF